jgi:hypothetical protein
MNILYLGEQDFFAGQGNRGNVVCCKQPGVLFVMFHADPNVCQYCEAAKPEFMQLGQVIAGAKFGLCNLSRCKGLVQTSFQTITPLDKVPLFILFVNGRPFMNYAGEKQLKHFAEFMQQALQRLSQATVQTNNGGVVSATTTNQAVDAPVKTPHGIEYDYDYVSVTNSSTIGQVTCTEEGVCYLTAKESLGTISADKTPINPHTQQGPSQAPQQRQQPPPQQMYQPQQPPQQMQQMQQMQYRPPQQQAQYYPQFQPAQQPYYPPPQPNRPQMTQPQQQYYAPVQQPMRQPQAQYYPQQPQQAYYPQQQPQQYR